MATSPHPRHSGPPAARDAEPPAGTPPPRALAVVLQREELEQSGWGHRLPARHVRIGNDTAADQEA